MIKTGEEKYPLPYYAKMGILLRIIDELKGTKDRREISFVYRNIKADKASKVFGLALGRFLGLVESDTKNVWLTDLGYRFSIVSEEQKKKLLAENLPSYYVTFLKWIKDSNDRTADMDSLKADVVNNFKKWHPSSRVLHESLLTFGDVVEYCGFINFIKGSKGSKSRFQLTDNGLQMLSGIKPVSEIEQKIQHEALFGSQQVEEYRPIQELPKEFKFPLRIQTRETKVDLDVTHESDWDMINEIINTIKTKWKESTFKIPQNNETESKSAKGESARDETGKTEPQVEDDDA